MATSWQRLGENLVSIGGVLSMLWVFGGPLFDKEVQKVYAADLDKTKTDIVEQLKVIERNRVEARTDISEQLKELEAGRRTNAANIAELKGAVQGVKVQTDNIDKQLDRMESQINTLTRALLPRTELSPDAIVR